MATVWTIPKDITERWLALPEVQRFLTSDDQADASADPTVRMAQFAAVTLSLEANIGRTFSTVQAASAALFDGISQGAPVGLKLPAMRLVLREIFQMAPAPEPMPDDVADEIGEYVYVLRDPRKGSLVHLGSGHGNEAFSLIWAALGIERPEVPAEVSRRAHEGLDDASREHLVHTIRQIYDTGLAPEVLLIARGRRFTDPKPGDLESISRVAANTAGAQLAEATAAPENLEALAARLAAPLLESIPTPSLLLALPFGTGPDAEDMLAAIAGPWPASTALRELESVPVYVAVDEVVRFVARTRGWEPARIPGSELFTLSITLDDELTSAAAGKRVAPSLVGLQRWPANGWVPHLTSARPGK